VPAGVAAPASIGKAWVLQSRIECRERDRHTEGGDGQPGAVREFGKGGRDEARQLSGSLAGQLKELVTRLDTIQGTIRNLK
jgi:hypothetical protein